MRPIALLLAIGLLPWPTSLTAQCGGFVRRSAPVSRAATLPGLLDPRDLPVALKDSGIVILHTGETREGYDAGHLPGARWVAMEGYAPTRGGLSTELPPAESVIALLKEHGVTDASRILVAGELPATARLVFTLDWLGLGDRTRLVDGGADAWAAAGVTLSTAAPVAPARQGPLTARVRPDLVVDADWVAAHAGTPAVALLDARTAEEYRGERAGRNIARPGHIPGAAHLDWTDLLEPDGRFASPLRLEALLAQAGAGASDTVAAYCRVGQRASVLYVVARMLGRTARIFDGSMEAWSANHNRPVSR